MFRISAATALVGGALTAANIAGAAVAGASPATPVPMFEQRSQLESLMLTPAEVAGITDAARMSVHASRTELSKASTKVSPSDCGGAFEPAQDNAYITSAWTNAATQLLADGEQGTARHVVMQAVVRFADEGAADMQMRVSARNWARCAGQTLSYVNKPGDVRRWVLGEPALRRDETVMVLSQRGASGTCERAMTVSADMVIDIMACDFGGGESAGQAERIAAELGANASAQPA